MATTNAERMQCMEVWGGNRQVDRALKTTGLDVWIYSKPHANSQNGGDVYYVSSCASGRITRILLADVSGHGEAVSDRAESLRALMRSNINYVNHTSLVNAVNREFVGKTSNGAFATALVGTFFAPTKKLTLSSAGHPNPFLFKPETKTWQPLLSKEDSSDQRNLPLGIEPDLDYSSITIKLQPGEAVLCFTDGLIEVEQPDGSLLGVNGLLERVSGTKMQTPRQIIEQLAQIPNENTESSISGDDVSIILFQLNDERVSFRDNVMAPFRFAKDVLSNRSANHSEG